METETYQPKTYRPKEGFEEEFKSLAEKKNNLSKVKEEAYTKARAEIDAEFSEREKMITSLLLMVSEEVIENTLSEKEIDFLGEVNNCNESCNSGEIKDKPDYVEDYSNSMPYPGN